MHKKFRFKSVPLILPVVLVLSGCELLIPSRDRVEATPETSIAATSVLTPLSTNVRLGKDRHFVACMAQAMSWTYRPEDIFENEPEVCRFLGINLNPQVFRQLYPGYTHDSRYPLDPNQVHVDLYKRLVDADGTQWVEALIAFRGTDTSSMRDLYLDAVSINLVNYTNQLRANPAMDPYMQEIDPSIHFSEGTLKVGSGWDTRWNQYQGKVAEFLIRLMSEHPDRQLAIDVVGHSLGGVTAQRAGIDLEQIARARRVSVWAFSAPQLGNQAMRDYYEGRIQTCAGLATDDCFTNHIFSREGDLVTSAPQNAAHILKAAARYWNHVEVLDTGTPVFTDVPEAGPEAIEFTGPSQSYTIEQIPHQQPQLPENLNYCGHVLLPRPDGNANRWFTRVDQWLAAHSSDGWTNTILNLPDNLLHCVTKPTGPSATGYATVDANAITIHSGPGCRSDHQITQPMCTGVGGANFSVKLPIDLAATGSSENLLFASLDEFRIIASDGRFRDREGNLVENVDSLVHTAKASVQPNNSVCLSLTTFCIHRPITLEISGGSHSVLALDNHQLTELAPFRRTIELTPR